MRFSLLGRRPGEDRIEIGGVAAVFSEAMGPLQITVLLQIGEGSFYRGAGELQVGGNGLDPRPALPLGIGAVTEVHIDLHWNNTRMKC